MFKIGKRNNKIIITIIILLLSPIVVWGINTVATGFKTTTSNQEINAHGVCKQVKHTGFQSSFVPTRTSGEWSAFLSNAPSNVPNISVEQCYGNWYTTGTTTSCNSFCADIGLKSTTTDGTNSPFGVRCSSNNYWRSGVYTSRLSSRTHGNCLTYNANGNSSGYKIKECFCGTGNSSVGVRCGSQLPHGFRGCRSGTDNWESCNDGHREYGYAFNCDSNAGGGDNS